MLQEKERRLTQPAAAGVPLPGADGQRSSWDPCLHSPPASRLARHWIAST